MLTVSNPRNFVWSELSLRDCARGNALDSYFTLKLFHTLMEELENTGADKLYDKLISPVTTVFADMEREGLRVSRDALKSVGKELNHSNINLEDGLYDYPQVHKDDNISSNSNLIEILYTREDGFRLYPPDNTAKGNPSVSAPTLKILLEQIESELSGRKT